MATTAHPLPPRPPQTAPLTHPLPSRPQHSNPQAHSSEPPPQPTIPIATNPPQRTNATLNLSVLRRHNPQIHDILSIAPYAVIYTFSHISQTWEKTGCEGAMFVCSLYSHSNNDQMHLHMEEGLQRYSVVVLNRRGMDNFSLELVSSDDVEITPEYVILQGPPKSPDPDTGMEGGTAGLEEEEAQERVIYGLWIFAEPEPSSTSQMREVNARLIQDCAVRAEESRAAVRSGPLQGLAGMHGQHGHGRVPSGLLAGIEVEMMAEKMSRASSGYGRQHGLDFGRQEAQHWFEGEEEMIGNGDAGTVGVGEGHGPMVGSTGGSGDVLGDLFRRARQGRVGGGDA